MNIQELFKLGMKRNLPELLSFGGRHINIGSSPNDVWKVNGADPLGLPSWSFPRDPLPYDRDSINTIHCYHFLEHLSGIDAIAFLRECERVMMPGLSVMNFCVPYYKSNLMGECLDHKSYWNENTFRNLFEASGYRVAGEWELRTYFIMIAGIREDNIALIGQLIK